MEHIQDGIDCTHSSIHRVVVYTHSSTLLVLMKYGLSPFNDGHRSVIRSIRFVSLVIPICYW